MTLTNKQILLASRPTGAPTPSNFQLTETPVPVLQDGQVLVKNHYLSLDPYMRGRMSESKSYAKPHPLNEVMLGGTVGEVMESKNPDFQVGDVVQGFFGWQQYGVSSGKGLQKLDASRIPMQAYLGPVGMPGVTAWYGVYKLLTPKAGETVVISSASGMVGSLAGQLAKKAGARVVGIAGGKEKCDFVVQELGFDACIDYKAGNLIEDLAAVTPDGIDGYFENVGGDILNAVMDRMNPFGRIAVCGMISGYNGEQVPLKKPSLILTMRLKIEGFIIGEQPEIWPQALQELGAGVASGELKHHEVVTEGIENAPQAFMDLLSGKHFGKQLVKLHP
ncbi:NADP-dependent oxidoreductase [Deinococcus misasensis]|uniref:NADP-dependent oxidoreductase n=1 Tax=Deinococcus misasensis TaxID=392413 RepID=UPI00054EF978|nr:NADP-dependent oxidoreductase [Deinococcus misasensis]